MLEATSTGFNPEYIGILPRWFGRIVSSETWQDNIVPHTFSDPDEIKGWAFRYKVRIFSWNTGDPGVVPDEQLHMANVVLPVTAGSGHGGYFETPSLAAGSVVTGFFLMVKVVKNLILMVFLQMQIIMFPKNRELDLLQGISNLMIPMVLMQKFLIF